jgi:glycosyltransferase involved in cell wall biosynthesis
MKISVVIPLYNKRDTILRALNSVLNQTLQPYELIVVDDGSTDGSGEVVAGFKNRDIRLITQPNAGVSAARNRGVAEAKGDWIAFLDADDEWKTNYLETISSLFEKYPACNLLATSYLLQDHRGRRRKIILNKLQFKDNDGLLDNYFEVSSSSHPPLWTSAVTIKRSALDSIGGFPVGIKSGEDLLTWARLAVVNNIAYSLSPLAVFIQDAAHTYNDKPNRIPQVPDFVGGELERLAVLNENVPGIRHYASHWHKMRASIFLRLGIKKQAFKDVMKALSLHPLNFHAFVYMFLLFMPASLVNFVFKKFGRV